MTLKLHPCKYTGDLPNQYCTWNKSIQYPWHMGFYQLRYCLQDFIIIFYKNISYVTVNFEYILEFSGFERRYLS